MEISRRELVAGGTGLAVGGGIGYISRMATENRSQPETDSETNPQSSDDSDGLAVTTENRATEGRSDATIKLYYWSDYQCPFCYRFENETLPEIRSQFIETDEVELVIKPVNAFGEDSLRAAVGHHCILEQIDSHELFIQWHNMMYEQYQNNASRNNGWASGSNQAQYVSGMPQINSDRLASCVNNSTYAQKVETDRLEGLELGLEGTPFFVLYNSQTQSQTSITGAQPFIRFANEIQSLQQ